MKITSTFLRRFHLDPTNMLLTVRNVQLVKEFFDVLDVRKEEYLDDIEFLAFMRSVTDLSDKQVYDVFDIFDVDNSGGIEFDEFYLLIVILIAIKDDDVKQFLYRHWRTCFELLDADGGKTVSTEEFEKLGFLFGFSLKSIRELFAEFDVAGDKELDPHEFRMFTFACIDRRLTTVNSVKDTKKSSKLSSWRKRSSFNLSSKGPKTEDSKEMVAGEASHESPDEVPTSQKSVTP